MDTTAPPPSTADAARQRLSAALIAYFADLNPATLEPWPTATLTTMYRLRRDGAPCPACGQWVLPADWAASYAYVPWGDRAHGACLRAGLPLTDPVAGWLVVRATAQLPDYLGGSSRLRRIVCAADGTPVTALVTAAAHDLPWQQGRLASGLLGGATIFPDEASALAAATAGATR